MKLSSRPRLRDFVYMTIGTALMSQAIGNVFGPANMVTGGFSGLSIMIKGMSEFFLKTGIPLWLSNLVLNIPLFLVGGIMKGWRFLQKTLFASLLLSFFLWLFPGAVFVENDLFLSSVFGGILMGIGIGMVLMAGATTGGTDLMASLICTRVRHMSIVSVMEIIDGIIVLAGACFFGLHLALYAIVAIFVSTRVSDSLIEGGKFAKVVYIITSKPEQVSDEILHDLERGLTGIDATGMYSGKERQMLFCVVSKKEIVQVKDIVRNIDPKAFLIVSDVREALGEGFVENA